MKITKCFIFKTLNLFILANGYAWIFFTFVEPRF